MIVEIDGCFFNPLLVTQLIEIKNSRGEVVEVWAFFEGYNHVVFPKWTCYNLAARINELIEEFNRK